MTSITRNRAKLGLLGALIGLASFAEAAQLQMPDGAKQTANRVRDPGSYQLPVGPWTPDAFPTQLEEGRITQSAWRIPNQTATTLQVLLPLRAQLEQQGYEILFECSDTGCGGFDFRFAAEVLAAPAMYVDLSDYHFLSARGLRNDHVSILVSRNSAAAFVQVITADYTQADPITTTAVVTTQSVPTVSGGVAQQLVAHGHVVLSDLAFESGSAELGDGDFQSLQDLAKFLQDNTNRRVVLVGHTDAVGSLEGNRNLSRKRANSVLKRLIGQFNVPKEQLGSEGAGYLSPIATNGTVEGREINRRVEAILLPE